VECGRQRVSAVHSGLCGNLGDGVNQAADLASVAASMPSMNFTPLMIFGN